MGAPGMNTATQSSQGSGNRFKKFFRRNNSSKDVANSTQAAESKATSVPQASQNTWGYGNGSNSNNNYQNGAETVDNTSTKPIAGKNKGRRSKKGILGGLLPVVKSKTDESTSREKSPSPEVGLSPVAAVPLMHESVHIHSTYSNPQLPSNEGMTVERIESIRPLVSSASGTKSVPRRGGSGILNSLSIKSQRKSGVASGDNDDDQQPLPSSEERGDKNDRSAQRESLFQWQDNFEKQELLLYKQVVKERDGFCRRVDTYDGSIIQVEGKPAYELGNYLGGGVAGVVYEGHRLLGPDEYPVRLGVVDARSPSEIEAAAVAAAAAKRDAEAKRVDSANTCLCVPMSAKDAVEDNDLQHTITATAKLRLAEMRDGNGNSSKLTTAAHTNDVALEATESTDGNKVIIDNIDAPSRSKHYAKAVTTKNGNYDDDLRSDASFMNGFMEESVAVKILNPVGFRILASDVTDSAVVARQGAPVEKEVYAGARPMEERHVWWLINPSSRNLRTLQRYTADGSTVPAGVQVDRGCAEKGLRISLIASFKDVDGVIKELPLNRCIEIWGHVPFEASDAEFKEVMNAIDRVNQGFPPPPIPAFLTANERRMIFHDNDDGIVPGRTGTATSSLTGSIPNYADDRKLSNGTSRPVPLKAARTYVFVFKICIEQHVRTCMLTYFFFQ
jgi:hypothetical protein